MAGYVVCCRLGVRLRPGTPTSSETAMCFWIMCAPSGAVEASSRATNQVPIAKGRDKAGRRETRCICANSAGVAVGNVAPNGCDSCYTGERDQVPAEMSCVVKVWWYAAEVGAIGDVVSEAGPTVPIGEGSAFDAVLVTNEGPRQVLRSHACADEA